MTCKDCLHHESCEYYGNSGVAYAVFYDEDKAEECPLFKDRSKWVAQKHGRWEARTDVIGFVRCSVCRDCNIYDDWADGKKWNYCPNCGALMTEGEDL